MSERQRKLTSPFFKQHNGRNASPNVVREGKSKEAQAIRIRPSRGIRSIDLGELWRFRQLLYFLVWRDIKAHYAQSVLGVAWAIIQPLAFMVVFTIVFGNMVKVDTDGTPYAIFSYAALVPWTYFATALTGATSSLIQSASMVKKTYLPRMFLPASAIAARLVDFGAAFIMLLILMAWFRIVPTIWVLTLPCLIIVMILTAAGVGMWLAALAVQYRDIAYGMSFLTQLLMYAAPVVYPTSLIPDQYKLLYGLNPMVGVIEGFRSAFLGTNSMPWDLLAEGSIVAIVAFLAGALYFRHTERIFADVI